MNTSVGVGVMLYQCLGQWGGEAASANRWWAEGRGLLEKWGVVGEQEGGRRSISLAVTDVRFVGAAAPLNGS